MQNKINDGREEDRIWHHLNCNYMLHLSGNMVFRSVFTRDPGEQYIILIYMKENRRIYIPQQSWSSRCHVLILHRASYPTPLLLTWLSR